MEAQLEGEDVNWMLSNRFDQRARVVADRHYNRRKVGSPQFMPSGSCVVFQTVDEGAVWGTSVPLAQFVRHAWPGAWVNSLFRRESGPLASVLIREALACSVWYYARRKPPLAPPSIVCQHCGRTLALVTFVDASKVKAGEPGYCYRMAGFDRCTAKTKGGLVVWHIAPEAMPEPTAPLIGNAMPLLREMTA